MVSESLRKPSVEQLRTCQQFSVCNCPCESVSACDASRLFFTAGIRRIRVRLIRTYFHIGLFVMIRIRFIIYCIFFIETFWANFLYCAWYTTSQLSFLNRLIKKLEGAYSFQELRWSTVACKARSCFISLKLFPNSEVVIVRRGDKSSLLHLSCNVVICFLGSVFDCSGIY